MRPTKLILDQRGSINLWFASVAPVLIMLFLYLFLNLTVLRDMKRSTQDVGDLVVRAALAERVAGFPDEIDASAARSTAVVYLHANLDSSAGAYVSDLAVLIDGPELELDPCTNKPMLSSSEGIVVKVLTEGVDIDPTTGDLATSPGVLVVMRLRVDTIAGEPQLITTYSCASAGGGAQ